MTGTFLYFAYGSNMLTKRLAQRTPSAKPAGTAYADGYALTFDKVSTDGSGKCHIERTPDVACRVNGVLFDIDESESAALDEAEGLGKGYDKAKINVRTTDGTLKEAIVYIATERDASLQPYHWYKALVVAGATEHRLPAECIEQLKAVASKQDANEARRKKNENLLSS
jgi:cation transport regulator ChaC